MRGETSPTARALLTLEILQTSPGVTAERLADRLGVSDRAARRYVAILREAGIPVESTTGPYGGYRVGRGLRLPPLVFTATEALGLVMAVLEAHHRAADPADPVGSALGKLTRALPEPVAAEAETVRRAAAPVPDRSASRPDPDVTAALVRAGVDGRVVAIDYRSESGREWSEEVDPWVVLVRHHRWYLLCFSHAAEQQRALRVDRIAGVRPTDRTFTPPTGLDPVAELEEHLASGWAHAIEVLVDLPAETAHRVLPRSLGRAVDDGAGRSRLLGTTNNPGWAAEELARLPGTFEVVGGPELRDAVRALGERLLAAVSATA